MPLWLSCIRSRLCLASPSLSLPSPFALYSFIMLPGSCAKQQDSVQPRLCLSTMSCWWLCSTPSFPQWSVSKKKIIRLHMARSVAKFLAFCMKIANCGHVLGPQICRNVTSPPTQNFTAFSLS